MLQLSFCVAVGYVDSENARVSGLLHGGKGKALSFETGRGDFWSTGDRFCHYRVGCEGVCLRILPASLKSSIEFPFRKTRLLGGPFCDPGEAREFLGRGMSMMRTKGVALDELVNEWSFSPIRVLSSQARDMYPFVHFPIISIWGWDSIGKMATP